VLAIVRRRCSPSASSVATSIINYKTRRACGGTPR